MNKKSKISSIHQVSGGISLFLLSIILFYAWLYRNFLGLGEGPFYDVTTIEKIATAAFVVGIIAGISSIGNLDFASGNPHVKVRYQGQIEKELEKHGIERVDNK